MKNITFLSVFALAWILCGEASAGKRKEGLISHLYPLPVINAHAQEIGLTKDQEKKLLTEQKAFQSEHVELKWKVDSELAALTRLLTPDHIDETKAVAQLAILVEKEGAAKRSRLAHLIRIKNLLTAEQQAKLSRFQKTDDDND